MIEVGSNESSKARITTTFVVLFRLMNIANPSNRMGAVFMAIQTLDCLSYIQLSIPVWEKTRVMGVNQYK